MYVMYTKYFHSHTQHQYMNHNISGTQIVVQNFIDIFVHTFAVILIDCAYLREREIERE